MDSAGVVGHYRVEISVEEGGYFEGHFVQEAATVQIEGQLEGDAWAWDEWSATGTYLDGVMAGYYFRSTAFLDEDGLQMDKRVYDSDDLYLLNIVEVLPMVDSEVWDDETSALGLEILDVVGVER